MLHDYAIEPGVCAALLHEHAIEPSVYVALLHEGTKGDSKC